MRFYQLFPLVCILLMTIIGLTLFPYLPDVLASHWGIMGEVNGYSSKTFALFFMPGLSAVLFLVFLFLPKVEPYKKNFVEFDQYYFLFINIIFAFFFYLHILTIFWHLGTRFNMLQALAPSFAVLFYYAGILMKHTKRNWFVGIRTPWTLNDDFVWEKTHQLGAILFQLCGLLALLALFAPLLSFYLILLPVIISSLTLLVYSFLLHQFRHRS